MAEAGWVTMLGGVLLFLVGVRSMLRGETRTGGDSSRKVTLEEDPVSFWGHSSTFLIASVVLFLAGVAMVYERKPAGPPADEILSPAEQAEQEELDRLVEEMLREAEKSS